MSINLLEQIKNVFSGKFLCPYCFQLYSKNQIPYICSDCGRKVIPGLFDFKPYKCSGSGSSKCDGDATVRRCPYCDADLPQFSLETPNLQFSIVGMSNSGKTNYITVMLNELSRISSISLALSHQTRETKEHHDTNVRYIYAQHTVPPATEAGNKMPQIWSLKNLHKKSGNNVATYTFTIYDGAGEDHENNMDPNSPVCRYIKNSKALIVVIDPLVIPGVIGSCSLDPQMVNNSLNGSDSLAKNINNVLNDLIVYIKTAKCISASEMIDIPVAVVLTKFDTIMNTDYFSDSSPLKSSSVAVSSDGTVNLAEIMQVSEEIQNWFIEIGEVGFVNNLKSNFRNMMLFGVSSYGAPPVNGTLPKSIRPHRVLDPLLWLFKKNGFVD